MNIIILRKPGVPSHKSWRFLNFLLLKRLAAIPLLALLLFNWVGYRLLVGMMENRLDTQVESQLDAGDYGETQLVSFKISLTQLPYYSGSGRFERFDGEMEVHGIRYKYVKRRLYHDSLEILCLPNFTVMRLLEDKNSFFERTNDLAAHNAHSQNLPHKTTTKFNEPACCDAPAALAPAELTGLLIRRSVAAAASLATTAYVVDEQPPERSFL